MLKRLYKRIIRKFDLSKGQLRELKDRLVEENICKGPFVRGEQNCPNTTALAIKEKVGKFKVSDEVGQLMVKYGVRRIELWIFYVLFDLPAILSEGYFRKSLASMRNAIDELIQEERKISA
ncbi:MAG: hypothetical protein HYW90_00105 [Candidatus Sungbacteria bacterium]|nr:hypothetical protein [Candidatus Sungbacteria bacterium]